MRLSRALIAAASIVACDGTLPPQGQVVLHLDTDAPVTPNDDWMRPAPLFDRVLVEIFPPGAASPCVECVRELVVDAEKMHTSRFSFGFVPRPREQGWRARLRLFRSAGRATPRAGSTIELVGFLPAVAEDGITELTATFRSEDVGRPRGTLEAPIIFDRGAPPSSAEGTWEGARVEDCSGEAPKGAVCVPGGAFFMGDPRVTIAEASVAGAKEHLVVLSPYYLDAREVTVGDVRASGLASLDSRGRAIDPKDDYGDDLGGECDYTTAPGPNELLPVTCASVQLASRYCEARGGALPTEAQLELVASRRGSRLAPWGDRAPACDEAVALRSSECSDKGEPFDIGARLLPERAGSGTLDRVTLPGGVILDLGANLAEWTRDAFASDDSPCWRDALLRDPACVDPAAAARSVKGGDLDAAAVAYAQERRARTATDRFFQYETVGFRCAYPGKH